MPKWFTDKPEEGPYEGFYLRCFWELNTERRYDSGPIPRSAIVHYGLSAGLDGDIIGAFVSCIRSMDAGYREWIEEEREKRRRSKN